MGGATPQHSVATSCTFFFKDTVQSDDAEPGRKWRQNENVFTITLNLPKFALGLMSDVLILDTIWSFLWMK